MDAVSPATGLTRLEQVQNASRTPRSRLADDLYRLYLAGMGWLLLPTYGDAISRAMPSSDSTVDGVFVGLVIAAVLAAAWSGWRGGPLMVTGAAVIHELGSPAGRRSVLAPQFLRQAIGIGVGGAVAAAVATAMGPSFTWGAAFRGSILAMVTVIGAVGWAVLWMVLRHGSDETANRPAWLRPAIAVGVIIPTALVASGINPSGSTGLAALAAVAACGLGLAWVLLDWVPPALLWRRAHALESMRAAMLNTDFHRVLINVRRAGETKSVGTMNLARSWMPTALYRFVAAQQHVLGPTLVRLAVGAGGGVLLVSLASLDQGLIAMLFAGCWLIVGIELTRSLAATADQITFVVHYRRSSSWILLGQLAIASLIAAALAAVTLLWRYQSDEASTKAALFIATSAVAGGAVQARLGSPNVDGITDRLGVEFVQPVLWARALAAPLLVAISTLAVFHEWLRPDLIEWGSSYVYFPIIFIIGGFVTSVVPLERSLL